MTNGRAFRPVAHPPTGPAASLFPSGTDIFRQIQLPRAATLLLAATAGLILGIVLRQQVAAPLAVTPTILLAAPLGLTLLWCARQRALYGGALVIFPLFILVGHYRYTPQRPPLEDNHIANQIIDHQEYTVTGRLVAMPTGSPRRHVLLLEVARLQDAQQLLPTTGRVRLSLPFPPPDDLFPGDWLRARARLYHPGPAGNPGEFDYAAYLAEQQVWVCGSVAAPLLLQQLPSTGRAWQQVRFLPQHLRTTVSHFLTRHLPQQQQAVYRALLLGDKSGLGNESRNLFQRTGVMHLLAISGLHIGLLTLFAYSILYWLLRRSSTLMLAVRINRLALFLSFLIVCGYAVISGLAPPVVRALLMTGIVITGLYYDRQGSLTTAFFGAAFFMLLAAPALLFSPGFQLSFMALAAILFGLLLTTSPRRRKGAASGPHRLVLWLTATVLTSVAATLATLPLTAYHFHRVALSSPLCTLLAEPFLCLWGLSLGLLATLCMPISSQLASLLFTLGGYGITAAVKILSFIDGLVTLSWPTPSPSFSVICGYYLTIALLCLAWSRPRFRLYGLLALMATGWAVLDTVTGRPCQTSLTILDVGRGSATVVALPQRTTYLVDGGSASRTGFDVGERVIAPFLWQASIFRLDGIVVSHPHADHYNGLFYIIEHFAPRTLWINAGSFNAAGFARLLTVARRHGMAIRRVTTRATIWQNKESRLEIIAPHTATNGAVPADSNVNHQSLTVLFQDHSTTILLPSDSTSEEERWLLQHRRHLHADILVAAHHGSSRSNDGEFLRQLAPRDIIVSTNGNCADLHRRIQQALPVATPNFHTTGSHGAITVHLDQGGYWITHFRAAKDGTTGRTTGAVHMESDVGKI